MKKLPDLDEMLEAGMPLWRALELWAITARCASLECPPDEPDFDLSFLILLRHKRRRFVCLIGRMQQGQRERFRTMATISLRRIVAIEFGM